MRRTATRAFGSKGQRGHSLVETILATAMSGAVLTTTLHAAGKVPDMRIEMAIGEARDLADKARAAAGDPRAAFLAAGASMTRVDYRGFDKGAAVTAVPGALGPVSFGRLVEKDGRVERAGFSIDLLEIPKPACARLAAWSAPDFDEVIVNGKPVGGRKRFDPAKAADACSGGADISLVIYPKPVSDEEARGYAADETPKVAETPPVPATSADILAEAVASAGAEAASLEGRLAEKEEDSRKAGREYVERKYDVEAYDEKTLAILRNDPELMLRAIEAEKARMMELYSARVRTMGGTPAALEAEILSAAARFGVSSIMVEKALAGERIE